MGNKITNRNLQRISNNIRIVKDRNPVKNTIETAEAGPAVVNNFRVKVGKKFFNSVEQPLELDDVVNYAIPNGEKFYYIDSSVDDEPHVGLMLNSGKYTNKNLPTDVALFIGGEAEANVSNAKIVQIFDAAKVQIDSNEGVIQTISDNAEIVGKNLNIDSIDDKVIATVEDSQINRVNWNVNLAATRSNIRKIDTAAPVKLTECVVMEYINLKNNICSGADNDINNVRGYGDLVVWGETKIYSAMAVSGDRLGISYCNDSNHVHSTAKNTLNIQKAVNVDIGDCSVKPNSDIYISDIENCSFHTAVESSVRIDMAQNYNSIRNDSSTPISVQEWKINSDFNNDDNALNINRGVDVELLCFSDDSAENFSLSREIRGQGRVKNILVNSLAYPTSVSFDEQNKFETIASVPQKKKNQTKLVVNIGDNKVGNVIDNGKNIQIKGLNLVDRMKKIIDGDKL